MNYTIYTDGSCDPKTGRGGWAFVILNGDPDQRDVVAQLSGSEQGTTNVRMELRAAAEALGMIGEMHGIGCRVEIRSDATTVVNGASKWLPDWRAKGVLYNDEIPVSKRIKNIDLWRDIDRLVEGHIVRWTWVKGHSVDPYNAETDRLAYEARVGQTGISMNSPVKNVSVTAPLLDVMVKAVRDEAPWLNVSAAIRIAKSVIYAMEKRGMK